jgi:hypothetical protein
MHLAVGRSCMSNVRTIQEIYAAFGRGDIPRSCPG